MMITTGELVALILFALAILVELYMIFERRRWRRWDEDCDDFVKSWKEREGEDDQAL